VTRKVLDIGVASAVINYNDGLGGIRKVFDRLGLSPGSYMISGSWRKDVSRVKNMARKSSTEQKLIRRKIRGIRKGFIDTEKEKEGGESYVSGNF